jgi:hypothetical protein
VTGSLESGLVMVMSRSPHLLSPLAGSVHLFIHSFIHSSSITKSFQISQALLGCGLSAVNKMGMVCVPGERHRGLLSTVLRASQNLSSLPSPHAYF